MKGLVAAICSLVLLSSYAHPADAATADEKVKLGNQLLGQGFPNDALIFYDQAVDINPHYWPAYLNRGKALLRLGQTRYARDDFKKTLELNPESSEARRLLAGGGRRTSARRYKAAPTAKSEPTQKSNAKKDSTSKATTK